MSRWIAALVVSLAPLGSWASAQQPEPTRPVAPGVLAPTALPLEPSASPTDPKAAADKPAEATKPEAPPKGLTDSLHLDDEYGLKVLFDSLHRPGDKGKHWYDKFSIKGYTQFRFGRTLDQGELGADPFMTGDRAINGNTEGFAFRRVRLVLSGDVSDHLYFYFQQEFAITLPGTTSPLFGQVRDLYGDVYLDKEKVHRLRVGLSKVPFGFDNLQSSQNRVPLDRSDAMNSATAFVERDLGVFYYWTPEEKQKLLKELVDGGLKGTGNYGIFGFGVYNGQGLAQLEQNLNLHLVARLTYPFRLPSGQAVEASVQGYTGEYVTTGAAIRPLGVGAAITPAGAGGNKGFRDQRLAGTVVWYPQPLGFQAEWTVGEGPALNDSQTAIGVRSLHGGYAMAMYKFDTCSCGIFTPYTRYQYYQGGYKAFANTPYGTHSEWSLGVEWQIRKEMELVAEYGFVDGVNLTAVNQPGVTPYRNFDGSVLRFQFQVNY